MKILIVTTAFYPEQAIGAVRISKFAKYLHQLGFELSIISLTPPEWARRDESLYFSSLREIRWRQIDQSAVFKKTLGKIRTKAVGERSASFNGVADRAQSWRQKVRSRISLGLQFAYTMAKALDWAIQVRNYSRDTFYRDEFFVIFTSYPSLASPFSGILLKRMGISKKLAIDFRDPISYGVAAETRFSLKKRLEHYLLSHSNVASFISDGIMRKVLGGYANSQPVCQVIPNGYDPDDLEDISKIPTLEIRSHKLSFCYVGSLYGNRRNLSAFFEVVSELVRQKKLAEQRVIIHYAGTDSTLFRAQAAESGVEHLIEDLGRISRSQSLALQRSSDICLVCTWNSMADQGVLTGKMFEFFMLRKPVVAIVNGDLANSETKTLILKLGAGICIEDASTSPEMERAALSGWIVERYNEKLATGQVRCDYNDKVTDYAFDSITTVLADALLAVAH